MSDVIERAREEVHALCSGKRRWTMSIPVEEDRDSDTVITSALDYAVILRAEAVRLREALHEQIVYFDRLRHRADVRGHDVSAMHIAEEAVTHITEVLSSTPATQREVERVRAMERVVETFDNVHDHSATLKPETAYLLTDKRYVFVPEEEFVKLEEAADDYDQVVKG
jgi:hypothetical protein